MKKNVICILLLSMVLILCACADPMAGMVPMSADTFHMFDSVDQLKDYLEKNKEKLKVDIAYYYRPVNTLDEMSSGRFAFRDDTYLKYEYFIDTEAGYDKVEQEYEYQSMTTAKYILTLFNSGPEFLKTGFLDVGYKLIELEGKEYCYFPEYSNGKLIAHYLGFLYENDVVDVILPAIAPLEEMIKYAEVERVYIK